jgi:hypothetical protein
MNIKRRTFFGTIVFAFASLFVPRAKPDLLGEMLDQRYPIQRQFTNRHLGRYEGREIPKGAVFSQPCGRFNPAGPKLALAKLQSVTSNS